MAVDLSAGRLLVAAPALTDPNFARTVVMILEYDESGTLGVVLNRPTQLPVVDVLEPWSELVSVPDVVFSGGPVGAENAMAIASLDAGAHGYPGLRWKAVTPAVGLLELEAAPGALGPGVRRLRIFAGYAGWGPGQLEGEMLEGAWLVLDSLPTDAFAERPQRLWADVLRRQGGGLALISTHPADPTQN